jgi:dipeptidyl aminopeptidase/acylaminoacyl peptidase
MAQISQRGRAGLIVGALLVGTAAAALAQTRPVTVDDVLALKGVGSPVVSPDGTRVLYTVRAWEPASDKEPDQRESRTRLWMVPASGGPARQITFGLRGDTQPQWSPDGRFISFLSARGVGAGEDAPRPQVYLMRADGGEARRVTDAKEGVAAYAWAPDSRRIAFVATDSRTPEETARLRTKDDERVFEGDFRYRHLWVVDAVPSAGASAPASGDGATVSRVTDGRDFTVAADPPSWSPDGTRVAFSANVTGMLRDERQDVYIVEVATRQATKVSQNFGRDSRPAWSPDGTRIAWIADPNAATPNGDGTPAGVVAQSRLVVYDVAARAIKDASSPAFDLEAGTPQWTPDGTRILFTTGQRAYTTVFAYDVTSGRYTALTERRTVQLGTQSRDGSVVAVTQDSPDSPAEVHVTGADFRAFTKLTSTNPQAAQFALGEAEVVTWKSDGFEIEGVLLKPVGFQPGKRYPLLVVAHGGPAGAYVNNYRVGGLEGGQLWAGQGWAVFYPNPRGSTNYGEKFLRANINDWGGGDYRDIMTGIDALVARGIADPEKLALIGWSYGGYMTAWSITQTARFKAAMVGAGLTNLWSMYGTNDIPNVLIGYFGGQAGPERLPLYMERSAMTRIDKVVTPTLILHGGSDERVPIGQAQELFRGLKDRGKPTELVLYPREGHGITEYYHQKDRLTRIQEWITRYTLGEAKKTTSP